MAYFALSVVTFLVHLLFIREYGYFRDEFYYLACADHLDWGYVDHPPLSIAILWVVRQLLGDSIVAIRLLPALAGAAAVWLTGVIARRLGAGVFGQTLAMTAALIAPVYLAIGHFFSMNSFELLFWTIGAYLVVRLVDERRPSLWLALGVVIGLGLLNKISVLWFAAGVGAAVLLTPLRQTLRTPWPWLSAVIAAALFAPYIAWQVVHDWPTLEFMRNASATKMATTIPSAYLTEQVLMMHPLTLPIWVVGLAWCLLSSSGRRYRALAIVYLVVLAILIVNRTSRPGYLAPAYPPLFAAGAVVIEHWLRTAVLRAAALVILLAGGALLAPLAMPILPVGRYIAYARAMGVEPGTQERKAVGPLPQHFADMHGWEAFVDAVARAHSMLTPAERAEAVVYAQNYGEAGAIDLLGRRYGLPPAISGHINYWLWGTRGRSAQVNIIIGGEEEDHRESYQFVERIAVVDCGLCMPYENHSGIFIARRLRRPASELWPLTKHYD